MLLEFTLPYYDGSFQQKYLAKLQHLLDLCSATMAPTLITGDFNSSLPQMDTLKTTGIRADPSIGTVFCYMISSMITILW